MTEKFDKLIKKILMEMSTRARPIKVNASDFQNKWHKHHDALQPVEDLHINGNIINVQMFQFDSYIEFYLVQDNSLVIGYIELEVQDDSGVTIMYIWNSGQIGSIMYKIYTEFLLDNFEYVKSDSIHTPKGFLLWKSFADDSKLQVYVLDETDPSTTQILVKNGEELEQYFGDETKMKYIYKLTRK